MVLGMGTLWSKIGSVIIIRTQERKNYVSYFKLTRFVRSPVEHDSDLALVEDWGQTLALNSQDEKHLIASGMWVLKKMERIPRTDRTTNEKVLQEIDENRKLITNYI